MRKENASKGKPKIFVFTNNHFDPTWRRCWDRRLEFEGESYVSYAELQDFYLNDNLALAAKIPDYKFEAECALVLRHFLERRPEKAADFARLSKEGRFAVSGAGDNVIDANMVLGESIVRNFLYGLLWVEDALGAKTVQGVRNDAFGNSAQIPQIFRGCGIKWATGFCYSSPQGSYFKGLDGSVVATSSIPCAGSCHSSPKYPPCASCAGKGCQVCGGRGIGSARAVPPEKLNVEGEAKAYSVMLCPEELLPCLEVGEWAERLRKSYDVVFAVGADALEFVEDQVAQLDNPPAKQIHPSVELNPNNTGCYVTRIKLKQECRRLEYKALGVEALLCAGMLKGRPHPKKELESVWRSLLFTMFHDAITSTHVDAAYDELMEMNFNIDYDLSLLKAKALSSLVEADNGVVSVLNPYGCEFSGPLSVALEGYDCSAVSLLDDAGKPVQSLSCESLGGGRILLRFLASAVPPFSSQVFKVAKAGVQKQAKGSFAPSIESSRFKIIADDGGILSIYDKKLKREIAKAGDFRPGEPFLESDEGSPWATLKSSCERARAKQSLKSVESGPGWQSMTFSVDFGGRTFTGGRPFIADVKVSLIEGLDRIDFEADAGSWEAFNARIRFAFPIPFGGDAYYEIPYGTLKRDAYKPSFDWIGANGDWPAINWAGVQGKDVSVAVFNKGTPSYKVEDDGKGGKLLLVSVLRAPMIPTYLHEPWEYVMTDFWGMRDAGEHRFEFSIAAYAGSFAGSPVVDEAEAYNAGAVAVQGAARLPQMPSLKSACARISSVKASEKGDALIVRVVEFRGAGGAASLRLPQQAKSVSKVDLLERNGEALPLDGDGAASFKLRPWEIATFRCELA